VQVIWSEQVLQLLGHINSHCEVTKEYPDKQTLQTVCDVQVKQPVEQPWQSPFERKKPEEQTEQEMESLQVIQLEGQSIRHDPPVNV
jgi:hypothetical protein